MGKEACGRTASGVPRRPPAAAEAVPAQAAVGEGTAAGAKWSPPSQRRTGGARTTTRSTARAKRSPRTRTLLPAAAAGARTTHSTARAKRSPRPTAGACTTTRSTAGPNRPPRAAAGAQQLRHATGADEHEPSSTSATVRAHHQPTDARRRGSEEYAEGAVRLLRRAVHDGVAPEATRAGEEAPEQDGVPRRGDERALRRVQRAPLQRPQRRAALRRKAAPPPALPRGLI
jgi:hypothetical protein